MTESSGRRSMRRRWRVSAAVIAVFCGIGAFAAAPARAATVPAFSDGSFETPVVSPHTFQELYQGQSMGPWTIATGSVDLNGEGFYQAADGVQTLDLNGSYPGTVSQTFSTVPLFKYEVSFALAGNPDGGPAVKTGQVLVNGKAVTNFSFDITGKTRANMGFVTEEFTFLATSNSTTLQFASTTSGAYGPVIDNVHIDSCLLVVCLT